MNLKDRILARLDEAREKLVKTFKFGAASVDLKSRTSDAWTLTNLNSGSRGKGEAKEVMKLAIAYADESKMDLVLHAVPDDDTDTDRLIDFYKGFGFVKTGGFNQMTRKHGK